MLHVQAEEMEEDHLTPEQLATLREIRARKGAIVKAHRMKKAVANNQAVLPRRADAQRTATTRNMKVRCFFSPFSLSNQAVPPWRAPPRTQEMKV